MSSPSRSVDAAQAKFVSVATFVAFAAGDEICGIVGRVFVDLA